MGEAWHPPGWFLDDGDRQIQSGTHLPPGVEILAEREKKWAAFQTDPEWIAARDASEKDGPIVATLASSILQPTSFSSVR